ncbi:MAG: diaminopimelate epimerase [Kiritimatiellae bacterium]|nr:diaminopimelate epimerase [Kiritimatiellia bacterium]
MKIKFTKMHGAGNDFVLIDDRSGDVPWEDYFLMAALAARRTGIGCEGIILVQNSDKADFKMRFLNPDGSEVALCGNGARCTAAFACAIGAAGRDLTMETLHCGLVGAKVSDDGVCVWMPEPTNREYGLELTVDGALIKADFINTGVPHLVVQVPNVNTVDVDNLGRALRLHPVFEPHGTNVNFVNFRAPNRMTMRTYERGVEAESGACGTGAVACAVVAVETAGFTLPINVKTPSGFDLEVDGDWRKQQCTGLTLTGPIKFVYAGEVDLDELKLGGDVD